MADIKGKYDEKFARVAETLSQSLDCGDDIGASAAVFIDGEPVVDIWGGYFDGTFTREWGRDTIICCHSTTKTMTTMAALVAADRGLIDLDERVAEYWPEFAQNGKENVLVRHVLGHASGLAGWQESVTWDDVYNLDYSTGLLEKQAPWWEPGTASGYHGITLGHLVSGLLIRVTGKTLGNFFKDEIADPLGADFHIGTGPEFDHRVAPFVRAIADPPQPSNPIADRVVYNPDLNPENSSTVAWRRAEIGGANGHGNARAVATIHSALVTDEVNGVRLLSRPVRERLLETQTDGIDLLMGFPVRWGMGFALESEVLIENKRGNRIAFWGGNGGSLAFVDFDERMTVSFVMNRWIEGEYEQIRNLRILKAAYDSLDAAKSMTVSVG
jgi:CubicO group peptidase (beta-lactamase class C family)